MYYFHDLIRDKFHRLDRPTKVQFTQLRLPFWQPVNRWIGGGQALIERIERIGLRVSQTLATYTTLLVRELISADLAYFQSGRLRGSQDCHFGNLQIGGSEVDRL